MTCVERIIIEVSSWTFLLLRFSTEKTFIEQLFLTRISLHFFAPHNQCWTDKRFFFIRKFSMIFFNEIYLFFVFDHFSIVNEKMSLCLKWENFFLFTPKIAMKILTEEAFFNCKFLYLFSFIFFWEKDCRWKEINAMLRCACLMWCYAYVTKPFPC